MECTITTPEELVFEGEVRSVVVPAVDGEMGFLPKHAPLVGTLGYGELRVDPRAGTARRRFFVNGGFVQVLDDRVTVLAVEAIPVEALDRSAEAQALDRLRATKPAAGASLAEMDEYRHSLRVARARARLAGI